MPNSKTGILVLLSHIRSGIMRRHLQEQDVKFSSSIAYSQCDTFQVNLHVICLVKSVMKEHLPMSSNLSNDTAIFKADQDCMPAFVSRQVPAGSVITCLLPPPFLFRGRIREYRKKPWPCVRSPPLKKNAHSTDWSGRNL